MGQKVQLWQLRIWRENIAIDNFFGFFSQIANLNIIKEISWWGRSAARITRTIRLGQSRTHIVTNPSTGLHKQLVVSVIIMRTAQIVGCGTKQFRSWRFSLHQQTCAIQIWNFVDKLKQASINWNYRQFRDYGLLARCCWRFQYYGDVIHYLQLFAFDASL